MDQEKFQEILKKYNEVQNFARKRAHHHERIAKRLEWALISCSATTTLLVALSSIVRTFPITSITFLFSTLVTVIASFIKSLKNQEKWFDYQKLSSDLEYEYHLYLAQEGIYGRKQGDREAAFTKAMADILHEFNEKKPHTQLPIDITPFFSQTEKE